MNENIALILDNLGIVTGGEKVFDDYAKSIGKTTAALSDMERKQALVNAVMASTDTSVGIAVSGVAKLESAWSNLGDALAKSLASSRLDRRLAVLPRDSMPKLPPPKLRNSRRFRMLRATRGTRSPR